MNKQTENRLGGELRSQHTAARLLEELENGRYSGAAQLPSELELASDLGVSRTVVRDALSELERDGYWHLGKPGCGAAEKPHGSEVGIL